jgi:hypothetical protein
VVLSAARQCSVASETIWCFERKKKLIFARRFTMNFFFFFFGAEDQTLDLTHAKLALYHWVTLPALTIYVLINQSAFK